MSQQPDWKEVAAQLRRPTGEMGQQVAHRMNLDNARLNHRMIDMLDWAEGERVLEIGPANGRFVPDILSKSANIMYAGIDISEDMVAAALELNREWAEEGLVQFHLGSSSQMPFDANTFDKVLTSNTIYFWENPLDDLKEIHRVLKPSGRLCLGLRTRKFMQGLPFTPYGFTMYEKEELETLLAGAGFAIVAKHYEQEPPVAFGPETVVPEFLVAVGRK